MDHSQVEGSFVNDISEEQGKNSESCENERYTERTMSQVIENTAFPSAMEAKLRRIRGRQIGLAIARAVAVAASVLIAAMLVAMLADWWYVLFHTGVRTAMTLTSLALSVAVFMIVGVRPVIQALGTTRAANDADSEVPQLEERWTTISHFTKSENQPTTNLAKAMLRQVVSEAVALGTLVEPARVVRVERLRKALLVVSSCAVILVVFLAVNWEQNSVLLRRFWAPTAPITATQLECVTGDVAVPRGRSIELVSKLSGLKRDTATLTVVTDSDDSSTIVLSVNPDTPETFTHYIDVDESFRYRIRAGDSQTEWHSITAIDPPEISEVRLTVIAPAYVNRPPYEKSLLPGRVKAIQGSRLTLEMRSEADLERFELLLTSHDESGQSSSQTLQLTKDSDGWYRFETMLENDLSLSPTLHSPYGLTNEDRRVCRIRVIPDKAPVVRVISPTDEMSVSPDEVIDIELEAHDDHGIAKIELIVYETMEDGQQEVISVQEIPLGDQQLEKHILAKVQLDLSEFDLGEGMDISYSVRVTDNRMLNLEKNDDDSRMNDHGEFAGSESKKTGDKNTDATSLAQSSESPPSRSPESPEDGQSPDDREAPQTTETAAADDPSGSPNSGQESPDANEVAAADNAAQSQDPNDASTSKDETTDGESTLTDKTGTEPAVADSGTNNLRVGDGQETAVADAEGQTTNTENEKPTANNASAVAAGKGDAPMPTDKPDASDGEAVASKDDSPPASNSDTPSTANDTSESTAVAATTSKPSEAAEPSSPPPTGGAPNPKRPEDSDPKLARGGSQSPQSPEGTSPPKLAQNGSGSPRNPEVKTSPQDPDDPSDDADSKQTDRDPQARPGSIQLSATTPRGSSPPMPPLNLKRHMKFEAQRGQNTESNRMRLKIIDRLAVVAEAGESRSPETMNTRELLKKIDVQLERAETVLLVLNEQDNLGDVPEKSRQVDSRLERVERIIANLRKDSKETKFEFVGLQMLDIGRTHVTPARDRMFVMIQDPGLNPSRNTLKALHHTLAARELIEALTKQFEKVARERKLAEALVEVVKIYEVYVEKMQGVLREAMQNRNPLERKMAVIEVDEAYLKRYAEVLAMRRKLTAELARIFGDDPRLMGKYMDLIKRRTNNLRNQLTELRERQEDISIELSGWLRVDEAQRPDVWIQVAEMRLLAAKPLAKDASQLEARTLSQLPLNLEPSAGTSGLVVAHAKEVALNARASSIKARMLIKEALENDEAKGDLLEVANELAYRLGELDAALELLAFEQEGNEETSDFVTKRLAESRAVAEQAVAWAEVAFHVQNGRYHGLAAVDQQKLAFDTDRLRLAMSNIETDLAGMFRPDDVPPEVANIVRELLMVMETLTFNQAAATYELSNAQLAKAEAQQTMATEGFQRAEELFDKMRRTVIEILDEREVDDPNIADLVDPTLDEFLERLEREPNLGQLLGIPNRPKNLRQIRDWLVWQSQVSGEGAAAAQQAAANAMERAKQMAKRKRDEENKRRRLPQDGELTEEEMKKFAAAENDEEEMEQILKALQQKIEDPATSKAQRRKFQKEAEMLAQMLHDARNGTLNRRKWQELARSDELKAMMAALANGEPIPDSQWNRLLSTLDTGLRQVRGRTPPEDYRKAIEQYQDQIRRLLNAESIDAN